MARGYRLCWSRMKPQDQADRVRIFREELEKLEREKILDLTAEQRAAVDGHIAGTLKGTRFAIRRGHDGIAESRFRGG